ISSLAFSADSRLLVSAAEDQTVCVWSAANIDAILGKRGLLPGVAVETRDKLALVGQIDADRISPKDQDKLAAGDVIEGVVEDGQVRALANAREFYEAISQLRPGQKVTLSRKRQQQTDKVELTVGQGIDERKPLLFFFLTRGAKAEDREWIGWNP